MRRVLTFDQVLDEAECLSIAERTDLVEILHKRMIENERLEIARDVKDARAEFSFMKHEGREAILLESMGTHDAVY